MIIGEFPEDSGATRVILPYLSIELDYSHELVIRLPDKFKISPDPPPLVCGDKAMMKRLFFYVALDLAGISYSAHAAGRGTGRYNTSSA
jgi:hypothetical protein